MTKPTRKGSVKRKPKPRKAPRAKAGTSKVEAQRRREVFVNAFLANGKNATQAAITAGYSPRSAGVTAKRLLKEPPIQALVAQSAQATADKYQLSADLAARSIYQELTFDPANLYREDGSLKDITELDEDTRMALAAVDFEQKGDAVTVRKVKWANRNQAREQLMKHLGMFERDNIQKGISLGGCPRAVLEALVDKLKQSVGEDGAKTVSPKIAKLPPVGIEKPRQNTLGDVRK